jgi:hypothetical protein
LKAFTLEISAPPRLPANATNQFWTFSPSLEPGYYCIQSGLGNLVIDVEGAGTTPGTHLDAYTQKTKSPGWNNQLWTFVDEKGNAVTPPPPFTPPPPPK